MVKIIMGIVLLFIVPLAICLGCLLISDFIKRTKRIKKNQNGK
tara:strand:- start:465 stop:593 length:129 start_codon:yes stop_codon:yes gene_type:complete